MFRYAVSLRRQFRKRSVNNENARFLLTSTVEDFMKPIAVELLLNYQYVKYTRLHYILLLNYKLSLLCLSKVFRNIYLISSSDVTHHAPSNEATRCTFKPEICDIT